MKRLERTAYHEAGHVVAAWMLHRSPQQATIVGTDDYLGQVAQSAFLEVESFGWDTSWRNRRRIEERVITVLGGCAAEARAVGRHNWVGASHDWHSAYDMLDFLSGSADETRAYAEWLWHRTRGIFENPFWWALTQGVAAALIERQTINAKGLRTLRTDLFERTLAKMTRPRA